MGDEVPNILEGKSLSNLRVVDLKQELEKRGLSKSGSKKELIKRLKQKLELEKLYDESSPLGATELKLNLDEATEQNEFVKQYLAEQQKIYARQKEVKRLIELGEQQRLENEGHDADSSNTTPGENVDKSESTDDSSSDSDTEDDEVPVESSEQVLPNSVDSEKLNDKSSSPESVDPGKLNDKNSSPESVDSGKLNDKSSSPKSVDSGKLNDKSSSAKSVDSGKLNNKSRSPKSESKCEEAEVLNEGENQNEQSENVESGFEQTAILPDSKDLTVEKSADIGSLESPELSSSSTMEPGTQQLMMSYSLADIQLPDSPGNRRRKCSVPSESNESAESPSNKVSDKALSEEHISNSVTNSVKVVAAVTNVISKAEETESKIKPVEKDVLANEDKNKVDLNTSKSEEVKCEKDETIIEAPKQDVHKKERRKISRFDCKSANESKEIPNKQSKSSAQKSNEGLPDDIKIESKKSTEIPKKELTGADDTENISTKNDDPVPKSRLLRDKDKEIFKTSLDEKEHVKQEIASDSEEKANSVHSEEAKEKKMDEERIRIILTKDSSPAEELDSKVFSKEDIGRVKTEDEKVRKVSGERKEWKKSTHHSTSDSSNSTDTSPERKIVHKIRHDSDSESNSQNIPQKDRSINAASENETNLPFKSKVRELVKTEVSDSKVRELVKTEVSNSKPNNAPQLRRLKIKRSDGQKVENLPKKRSIDLSEINLTDSRSNSMLLHAALDSIESIPEVSVQKSPKLAEETVVKFTPRKLNLTGVKSSRKSTEDNDEKTGGKKRRWGNYTSLPKASLSISTDSLKSLIPDFKVVCGPQAVGDLDEVTSRISPDVCSPKEDKIVKPPLSVDSAEEEICEETPKKMIVMEIVQELPVKSQENRRMDKSSSPHQHPRSPILFIKNLVRPFTLLQLKELLKQTGEIVEEGFWIDKIKSKCFVTYESKEQATNTREALNGTRWPVSNPKILSVEFSTQDELDFHRQMREQPKTVAPLVPPQAHAERQSIRTVVPVESHKKKEREERKKEKDRPKQVVTYIREWDKDKISQESPESDRHPVPKDLDKSKSSEKKKDKKDSKRKQEEDTPAKLLDDLFQKTKSCPCIYWLPLTEEQVKEREEERRLRREEREKRNQQQREQEEAERRARRKERLGREKENRSRSRTPIRRR